MLVALVKVILALSLIAAFRFVLRFKPRFDAFFKGRSDVWLAFMWVSLRLVPFLGLYTILNFKATSDLIGFYNGAVAAEQGLIPYRDFVTVYAPFYSYLTAIPIQFWNDPRAIIILMMVVEGLAVWLTYRLYRLTLTTVLLYLLLPATLLLCVIGGQEDVWMWAFGLLTIPLIQRNRILSAGIVLGLAMVATKALFVLFVPIIFFWVDNKVKLLVGMLLVGGPVLAWLYTVGDWTFLMPIQLTQDPLAPNLRSVLHPILGVLLDRFPLRLFNYMALISVVIISVSTVLRWKKAGLPYPAMLARAWVLVYTLIMFLVPSAYAVYAFGFMLPIVAGGLPIWQRGRPLTVLLLFNLLTTVQPTAWWRLGQRSYFFSDLTSPLFLLEYTMQLGIIGCLLYFVVTIWSTTQPLAQSVAGPGARPRQAY
ncbi:MULTISPECIES: hypothetical protein [Spirosoma]|uniref:DUF2029 domain-containing protein n=1 Tax=Spirosoma sordidisoli TaxID=2502893 RepID=A0A4Q2UN73_9BACT|nr:MULTISPECIES: hypothetical protein [Spirosoma]RYC71117.1 hypothetical protein EQG79_02940 [Spirosoma sordidisoli]